MLCLVGQDRDHHREGEGTYPRGHAVQLGADLGVAITDRREMMLLKRRGVERAEREPSNNSGRKKCIAGSESAVYCDR